MTLLAHNGGWDEILLFLAVPAAWTVFLLVRSAIKKRRNIE